MSQQTLQTTILGLLTVSCPSAPVQWPPLGHVLSPGGQQASVCESAAGERREPEGLPAWRGNSVRALQTASQGLLSAQAGQEGAQLSQQDVRPKSSGSLGTRWNDLLDSCMRWGASPAGQLYKAPLHSHHHRRMPLQHDHRRVICSRKYDFLSPCKQHLFQLLTDFSSFKALFIIFIIHNMHNTL